MKKRLGLACAAAVLMGAGVASAGEVIWVGNTDVNFGTAANWTSPFVADNSMLFGAAGTAGVTLNNNLAADINVAGLTFTDLSSAYTIAGNAITLGGNIGFSGNPAEAITQTINLAMILSGTRVVTTTANGNITLGGIISGGFGLTKQGEGMLTLKGGNTFTGPVTLNAGTLRAEGATALGDGSLLVNGGILQLANDGTVTFGRPTTIAGNSTIVVDRVTPLIDTAGTMTMGTLSLGGVDLTINRGANMSGTGNAQVTFGATTLTGSPTLYMGTRALIQFGAISESGGAQTLTLATGAGGNSLVILNGAGSWTGGTVVNSGTLRGAVANSLGASGSLTTMNAGTLDIRHANAAAGRHVVFAGSATLAPRFGSSTTYNLGSIQVNSGRTLTISSDRSGTTATGQTLSLSAPITTTGPATITLTGGNSFSTTLTSTSTITLGGNLTLNPTSVNTATLLGAIGDGGNNYGVTIGGTTGTPILILNAVNTYGGNTTISSQTATIRLGIANAIPFGAGKGNFAMENTAGSVTLDLNGFNQTLNGFSSSGAGTKIITNTGAGTILTIGDNAGSGTFAGTLSGALSLVKTGGGVITLAGTGSYTGTTTVNGGLLNVAPGAINANNTINVGTGGNGTLAFVADNAAALLTLGNNVNINLGSATTWGGLVFDLGANTVGSDRIALQGTGVLTVGAGGGFINGVDLGGFTAGSYNLLTGPNNIVGGSNLLLGNLPGGFTYSLDATTDSKVLTLIATTAASGNLYWTGDADASWAMSLGGNSNWSTSPDSNTEAGFTPGSANTVNFSAAGAGNFSTTLDNNFSVAGINILTGGSAVSIGQGLLGTLTLGAGGIDVQTGAPASFTINAPVALNGAQTWNVADADTLLTIGGILSGGQPMSDQATPGSNISLTITGDGRVTFDNAGNTFTGDILVDGGGFVLDNFRDWGLPTVASSTSHTIILDNGGRLYVTGTLNPGALTTTSYNLIKIGDNGGTIDTADGVTLQLDDPGQLYGNGTLTKTGTGILLLRSHEANFGGVMDIKAGLIQVFGGAGPFGMTSAGTIVRSGAALDLRGQAVVEAEPLTVYGDGLASNPQGVIFSSTGTGATFSGPITLGGDVSMGGPNAVRLNGVISGDFALTKVGAGTLTLAGDNTYTGSTTINGGTLTLGAGGETGTAGAGTIINNGALIVNRSNAMEISVEISGSGTLTKQGAGTLTLSGINTYAGLTTVSGGALRITNAGALGATDAGTTVASGAALELSGGIAIADETLSINGTGISTGGALRSLAGNNTYGGVITLAASARIHSDADLLTVSGGIQAGGTSRDITFGGAGNILVTGKIGSGGTTPVRNLVKDGGGTVTLSAENDYTGTTTVNNGILAITGTKTANTAATSIGTAAAAKGMLYVGPGAEYQSSTFAIGNNATGVGSLVIDGGTVVAASTADNTGTVLANAAGGGYGGLFLESGSFTTRRLDLGSGTSTGTAVVQMSGGTFNWTEYLIARANRWELTFSGVNAYRTGTLNDFAINERADSVGAMTVSAGSVDNSGQEIVFGRVSTGGTTGTTSLNLTGGTLTTDRFIITPANFTASYLNFNGGTLRANVNHADFLPTGLTGAYVHNGGAIIDSNGRNITIAADLVTPTGDGVTAIPVDTAGSGYIGAPYVEITGGGGGFGATASATVDLDPNSLTYGKVTGITITNPGNGYTEAPTITLLGGLGAGGTAATLGTVTTAANTSGGLTKIGEGTLTLTGANTYSGGTTINAGVLALGSAGALGNAGVIGFGGGTLQFSAANTTDYSSRFSAAAGQAVRVDTAGQSVTFATAMTSSGGTLTKLGAGTLVLSGANTFTGGVTLNEGTLRATSFATALGTGDATLVLNGGTLHLANDGGLSFGRNTTINGNATIIVDRLNSSATGHTHTFGTLAINGDTTLRVERGANITGTGNGQISFQATTLAGNLTLTRNERGVIQFGNITEVGGARSLTVAAGAGGNSVVILSGTGAWTGGTVVSSGQLRANLADSLPAGGLITLTGGTLDLRNANAAEGRNIVSSGGTTLALTVSANTTFNIGTLSQTAGTLTITSQRAGASTTDITHILNEDIVLNGSLTFNTVNSTWPQVTTLRYQGAITHASGTGELRKTGAGILILENQAQYGGNTRISNGTLRMGVANALPTGAGTGNLVMDPTTNSAGVANIATLDLNGFSHTVNGMSSSGLGTSVINNMTATPVTLTVGDNNGGGIFGGNIQNTGGGALSMDKIGTGAISLSGQNAYTGSTTVNGGVLSFVKQQALSPGTTVTAGAAGAVALGAHASDDVNYWLSGDIDTLWDDGVLGDISIHADSRVGIDTTAANFTYSTAWSTRGLIKLGTNTLFLTGNNTYAGGTDILAGTLSIGDGGATGALGTGNVLNNANLTINRDNAYEIANNISGSGSLTQSGTGVTTLSGNNTYTGNTTVNGGTLNVTGTITGNPASSVLIYGGTSTENSIVNVSNDMTLFGVRGSNIAGGVGVYNQTAGTVDVTGDGNTATTYIANVAGSYGYFNLTGGTFKTGGRFAFGATTHLAAPSISVAYIGGSGRLDQTDGLWMLNYSHAQITVADNGEIDRTGAIAGNHFGLIMNSNTAGGQYGVLNVAGGSFRTGTTSIRFGNSTTAGAGNDNTAFINLAAGTLEVGTAMTTSLPSAGANNAYLNFAGGTLKTTAGIVNWIPTSASGITFTSTIYGPIDNSALSGAPSFAGGLVFDSNGFNSSIGAALGGATANGVAQSSLTVTGGSGYVGAPEVIFTGGTLAAGGSPAAGYALIDGGAVTGIVITSPGSYTAAPTVTLTGGGGTGASVGVGSLVANTSGGLTKIGEGTLTLTGANTFTGVTTVNGGRLSVTPGAVANTSGLVVGATGNASFDLFADLTGAAWAPAADVSITLGSASTWGGLGFDLGTASDTITLSGTGALTINAGGGVINVNNVAGFGAGTYDLVTGPNNVAGGANLTVGLMPGGFTYGFDYTSDPTVLSLIVSAAASGSLYWTGDASSFSWRDVAGGNSNWSTASDGLTEAGFSTGADNTAIFNSGAGAIDVTLDGATQAKGLKLTSAAGGPLTINPGINNGSLALGTDGIDIQADAPNALTIAAAVALNGVQTWNVADAGTLLTIGGILSGGEAMSNQTTPGINVGLTITGAGRVTFDNTGNTFTGDILVDGGGFVLNNLRDWGAPTVASTDSHTIILDNGARLYVTSGTINPTLPTLTSFNLLKVGSGGATIDIAEGAFLILDDAGQLFGSGALTKTGTGTLALGNQGSMFGGFTGTLDIEAGVLRLDNNNSGGFGTVDGGTTIRSGAALNLNARTVTELEPLTIYGDGLASNPQGVIYNSSGTAATFSGPITLGGNVSLGGPNSFTLNGAIGGAFALTKVGAGQVSLGVANEYTGLTTISAGTIALTGAAATLGTTDAGTVVQNGGALRIHQSMTLTENLTLTGTGVGPFDNANTYGALVMNFNTGTWALNGAITLDGGAVINAYASGVQNISFAQGIAGTGDLTLRSGASNNGRAVYTLSAPSTYDGDTILLTRASQGITVVSGVNNALPTGTVLKLLADHGTTTFGKFVLNGFNQEVAGIEGAVADNTLNSIVGGAETLSTLTVNNTADFTYDGRLGNTGANENNLALVKKGAGKLSLTDANTYMGGTTVEAGTLTLGENGALGGGAVRVNSGATLDVSAKTAGLIIAADNRFVAAGGTVTGDLTLQSGSYLSLVLSGSSPLGLTVSGDVTLDASFGIGSLKNATGGELDWSLIGNGNYALISTASTFDHITNFGAGNAADIGDGRTAYFDNGSLQLYVIPEPASLGTLGILALAALLRRRLRR